MTNIPQYDINKTVKQKYKKKRFFSLLNTLRMFDIWYGIKVAFTGCDILRDLDGI